MSLNRSALVVMLTLLAFPCMRAQMTCPATVKATSAAVAPQGWDVAVDPMDHGLQRISIYQKDAGGKKYDLAPDSTVRRAGSVVQVWEVPHEASMTTYLQCRYKDTDAALVAAIGAGVAKCSFRFVAGPDGAVLKVLAVSCR